MKFMFGLQHPLTWKLWTTLSNPCNKVRGKYVVKEVFLRLPSFLHLNCSCVVYYCVCYHCLGMYPVYICMQHVMLFFLPSFLSSYLLVCFCLFHLSIYLSINLSLSRFLCMNCVYTWLCIGHNLMNSIHLYLSVLPIEILSSALLSIS